MKQIKLFDPYIDKDEKNMAIKVLDSHFWASGSGTGHVKEFEEKFSKFVNAKNSIAVNSGTSALSLALSTYDIKNKEVIIPSLSFVSTANAIVENGGIPKFVEIDEKTLCIDVEKITKALSKKTKIILPVHFGGLVSNLKEIVDLCKNNELACIDDAAHAAGSKYGGKKIGGITEMSCFSFHPVKNLAMPTGGLISINRRDFKTITKKLKEKRWCGITNRKNSDYDIENVSGNYYMNEFSAAIGLSQLKKLNHTNKIREKNVRKYFNYMATEEKMPMLNGCSYHFYWIRVKNRKKFRRRLAENGIETGIHYRPIHTFTYYKSQTKLPITEKIASEIVTLPTHPNLTNNDIERIIRTVNNEL